MKTIFYLFFVSIVLLHGCKKANSSDDSTLTPVPVSTREFISFKISGDSLTNEYIVLDTGTTQNAFGAFNKTPVNFRIDVSKNGKTLVGFFNIKATQEGLYPFDSATRGGIFLPGYSSNPNIFSKSGNITITHFPRVNLDYATGTFNGTFVDIYDSSHFYTVTEGKYRIQRVD